MDTTLICSSQLLGLPGMPKTRETLRKWAATQGWVAHTERNGKAFTVFYEFQSLPEETQNYLRERRSQEKATPITKPEYGWHSTESLLGLPGMSATQKNLMRQAQIKKWTVRFKQQGMRQYPYLDENDLPVETQKYLQKQRESRKSHFYVQMVKEFLEENEHLPDLIPAQQIAYVLQALDEVFGTKTCATVARIVYRDAQEPSP